MAKINIENIVKQVLSTQDKLDFSAASTTLVQLIKPLKQDISSLNRLGLRFYQQVEYEFARQVFEFILEQYPDNFSAHNNLGLSLNRLGLSELAIEHYQQALKIKPDYHQARSNYAYTLLYFGKTGRREILTAHRDIAKYALPKSLDYQVSTQLNTDQKKIRLGYVSSDFRNHAVGRFIQGVLEKHNRQHFEIHIFDNRKNNNDDTAKHLKSLDLKWHDIANLSSEDVIQLVLNKQINILIDLSGHTNGGRPDVFCHRVAPVQINYLGYPNTSGFDTMAFRIGDDYADLKKFDSQHSEKTLRLPHAMWTYSSWNDAPKNPTKSPALQNGFVTFGSANNHAKLQEKWLKTWAKVLLAVPESKLLLKSRALKSPVITQKLYNFFSNAGVNADRISMLHFSATREEHWQHLNKFDIALDTYPYNGTTTSCDLLNLGIPIVTRSGQSHVSRTTGSILNTLGLDSWIASSDKHFIDTCIEKASNLTELIKLRQSLAERFQNSTLGNPTLFMISYEQLLKTAWNNYLAKHSTK